MMTIRKAREKAFIAMFEYSFGGDMTDIIDTGRENEEYGVDAFGEALLQYFIVHTEEVDAAIESKLAKGWKVGRLPRTNLAILRLAVAEMRSSDEDMDSIVINEAVELAKTYAADDDYQFVNGVLGSLSRQWSGDAEAQTASLEE